MARYRKKPVQVDAVCLTGWGSWPEICTFIGAFPFGMQGVYVRADGTWTDLPFPEAQIGLLIPTLEGVMLAREGDFIIRGVQGELYPCKPDIFAATYEYVDQN